jgi:hypothetical protein
VIDIRARNSENAGASSTSAAIKAVTYTVRVVYSTNEVKPTMARTKAAQKPKMGRPLKDPGVIRASRGVRIDVELIERVNDAVKNGYISGATNFSEAVEKALTLLLKKKAA